MIDAITGFEKVAAWAQARQARVHASSPYAPDEVGFALRLSRWTATARLVQTVKLVERPPETLDAWETGQLDERRVAAICEATRALPVERARAVQPGCCRGPRNRPCRR